MSKTGLAFIPLSEPEISGNEWKYIKECLDTGWVSSAGSYVDRFEEATSKFVGRKYAIAVVNGTSALHISLMACGIGPGDEVIVPTLTFIAPVNAVKYCGAHPLFVDCQRETLCMDVQKVVEFLEGGCWQGKDGCTYNKISGRKISAVIPVHIFGHPVDMDPLVEICRKKNIIIIEDATESLGSEYKGKKTGGFGDAGCFSFNGNKIITTGGGGMVVTDNDRLASRIRHLSTQAKKDPFEYDHDEIGYNYRLTNIQAAMGVAQMERLEEFIEVKRKNLNYYREFLKGNACAVMVDEMPWAVSNFWFYTVKVPPHHKDSLMKYLISKRIQVRPVWKLIHTLPMYVSEGLICNMDNALEAYETCINVPCSVSLTKEDVRCVAESINSYFSSNE